VAVIVGLTVGFLLGGFASVSLYALRAVPDVWLATLVQFGDRLIGP
jgi:hypothetical protein